ncbi:MAG: 50S ribosomal protein L29 [Candidatus Magasanikbacteria bacterium]|nr:50S ribosomal protein L29 [Candidatus Magasanikbacteria bacterium]
MSIKELRNQSTAELNQALTAARQELHQLRLRSRTGAFKQAHRLRQLRKDIARSLTILKERQSTTG